MTSAAAAAATGAAVTAAAATGAAGTAAAATGAAAAGAGEAHALRWPSAISRSRTTASHLYATAALLRYCHDITTPGKYQII